MSGGLEISVEELMLILEKESIKVDRRGPAGLVVDHLRSLEEADPACLTFYHGEDPEKVRHLRDCVLVCKPGVGPENAGVGRIETDNPKLAFYMLAQRFNKPLPSPGIHPTALVDPQAEIHPSASIGAYCVLGACKIEDNAVIRSQVTIYDDCYVGARTMIEPGTCIGPTGQIWAWGEDGKRWIMPQVGGLRIEEDCYIGSNVSIVRGALQDTVLRKGARVAHGSMIGHNCYIGKETFLSNRVAMAGSTTIGDYCFLGSGSVFRPGVKLADYIVVGAGAVVTKNFEQNGVVLVGAPAKVFKKQEKGETVAGVPVIPPSADHRE